MAEYDGSIRILTDISTKMAEKSLGTLSNTIVKTVKEISSLRSKMDTLKDTKIPTEEYKKLQSDLSIAEKELAELIAKQTEWEKLGVTSGVAWDALNEKIATAGDNVDAIKEKMQALSDEGKDFTLGQDTTEYANYESQLQNEQAALEGMTREYQALEKMGDPYARLSQALSDLNRRITDIRHPIEAMKRSFSSMVENMKARIAGLAASIINGIAHPFQTVKTVAGASLNGVKKLLSGMASVAKRAGSVIGSLASKIKNAASSMLGFGRSTKSASGSMKGGLMTILKYGLGIRSLYVLFNKLRSAIKEGFGNLYKESDSFKNSVDILKASTLTLKNAFAAAFRPLVEIAIPYIQKAIEWLTRLADAFGQIMAAITGQKTYTKAIKQTTAAVKEQNKAQNKQLSGLDKLNNLTSDSGGADSGGAGEMFEEVPVFDKFKDIAQWLKDMWENADFTELGTLFGTKLKNALDNIPWDGIKEAASKIGKRIATLINGFVEVEGLGLSIGKTLAEAINTGFEFLNSFVHNLHWDSVGKFIAESLNGIFQNIDWDLIYDTFVTGAKGLGDAINAFADNLDWGAISTTISNFVNTFIDTLYAFITTVDWKGLGTKVGTTLSDAWKGIDWGKAGATLGESFKAFFDFIGNAIKAVDWQEVGRSVKDFLVGIDWAGVAESFFSAIGAAFGALAGFLVGLIGEAWDAVVQWWHDVAYEDGEFTILGLLEGIKNALAGIFDWIWEHVFTPFIDGFKEAFGIASPSTVMEEMGKYIIEGLFNGITSLIDSITETWESMKATALEIWDSVKESLSDTWDNIKKTATDVFEGLKESISNIWDSLWSNIKGVINSILGGVESMSNGVVNGINAVIRAMNGLQFDIPDWIPGMGGKKFGFDIPELKQISIPKLATGTVIPPNKEFLAVLGDQKHGTNIEAPLDTIKQALREELQAGGGLNGGAKEINLHLTVECEGTKLLKLIQKLDLEQYNRTQKPSFQY